MTLSLKLNLERDLDLSAEDLSAIHELAQEAGQTEEEVVGECLRAGLAALTEKQDDPIAEAVEAVATA